MNFRNATITSKEVRTSFVQLAVVILASMTIPYAGFTFLVASCVWSLFGIDRALKALTLVVLIKTLNQALVPGLASQVNAIGWIVLGVAGTRILATTIGRRQRPGALEFWLLIFVLVVAIVSFINSGFLSVSLFKLFSFSFVFFAVFSGYRHLYHRGVSLLPWFVGLWLAVLGLSLSFLTLPTISYFRDEMGFQGVLNQPQAMAVFCVPAAAWASSVLFLHRQKSSLVNWAVFILSWVSLFLTRGRVGLVAIGSSGLLIFMMAIVSRRDWRTIVGQAALSKVSIFLLLLSLTFFAVFSAKTIETLSYFVHKGQADRTLSDSFEMSRGFLIKESIDNFKENKWVGIGFGVSQSKRFAFKPVIEPITGLPISASTEKANLVVALLEEVGIIGTLAFLPFFFAMIRQVKQHASFELAWMLLAVLAVNIGEMVFFSMGGLGLYSLLLVGLALFTRGEYCQNIGTRVIH